VRRHALVAARRASRIIAVSRSVRDSIVEYTNDPARVVVVPNGVDPSVYHPGPVEARDSESILYVGLINRNKGIDVLLESMRHVVAQRPNAHLSLPGGSFYRNTRLQSEALQRHAVELGMSDHVTFLGHRSPLEVAQAMAKSTVVVLPSR